MEPIFHQIWTDKLHPQFRSKSSEKQISIRVRSIFLIFWTETVGVAYKRLLYTSDTSANNIIQGVAICQKLRFQQLISYFIIIKTVQHLEKPYYRLYLHFLNLLSKNSVENFSKACILKTKARRANLRPFFTPFTKPHSHQP